MNVNKVKELKQEINYLKELLICKEKYNITMTYDQIKDKLYRLEQELNWLIQDDNESTDNQLKEEYNTYIKTQQLHRKHRQGIRQKKDFRLKKLNYDVYLGSEKRKKGFRKYKNKKVRLYNNLVGKSCLYRKIYDYKCDVAD